MSKNDPLAALAVGLSADHQAEKKTRAARKPKPDTVTEPTEPTPVEEQERVEAERPVPAERVNLDTPPAPGDDAESVFDRRLERLNVIVDEAAFDSGTAFGDARDCILDLFKHQPKAWSAMTPSEKNGVVKIVETAARKIIGKIVLVIAQEESDTIEGTLDKKWGVNGETLEAKVKIENADDETLMELFKIAGHRIVIVSADDKRFMSARRSQDQGRDQMDMPLAFADARPIAPTPPAVIVAPPADDSDLNPDDEVEDQDDALEPGPVDPPADPFADPAPRDASLTHGIFDNTTSEWLAEEREDGDIWTDQASDAKAMTQAEAQELVDKLGEKQMEALPLDGGDDSRTHEPTSAVND